MGRNSSALRCKLASAMTKRRGKGLSGTIAASWTRRAAEYARARGLPLADLLQTVGIDPSGLDGEGGRLGFRLHRGAARRDARDQAGLTRPTRS